MILTLFQITLGIILFFIINWIGKNSFSIGYMQMSLFYKEEEAPAYNYLLRVFAPIVFLIIVSTILYKFGLDYLTENIYLVSVYYVLFRVFFNLFINNRFLLINWKRVLFNSLSIILGSYLVYEYLIKHKINIIPDFNTISNELWIIIIIFIYQILNKIQFSKEGSIQRKNKYLNNRFIKFKNLYEDIIVEKVKYPELKNLIYSIMIFEDFNRPKVIRQLERLSNKITKEPHTIGIMQIKSHDNITDYESVELAIDKLNNSYENEKKSFLENNKENVDFDFDWILGNIISSYNKGDLYYNEISDLYYELNKKEKTTHNTGYKK
ncbi:MAG: hypothetical protein H6604_04770 [Flavobacteriales bacterium]|nr:hypothetical protein [Flavobacteriales bacterium]